MSNVRRLGMCIALVIGALLTNSVAYAEPARPGDEEAKSASARSSVPPTIQSGPFTYANVNSGLCVETPNWSTVRSTEIVQWHCNGSTAQQWFHSNNGSGAVTFQSGVPNSTPMCIDGIRGRGRELILWECDGTSEQWWQVSRPQPGVFTFRNLRFDVCWDLPNWSTTPGQVVFMWDCNGSTAQRFR